MPVTFDDWYRKQEWRHDPEDDLRVVWDSMRGRLQREDSGNELVTIESWFDTIIGVVRNEYGD